MKKIIFVTGLPRANTTLMCNVLANNPNIGGGETSPLLEYIYGARANFSSVPEVKASLTEELMKESFLNFCRNGMSGYAEAITKKKIYLDKSRGWLHYSDFLMEILPDAKIIVMVRDIRSVLSSFEKKWRENPSILDYRDNPARQDFITIDSRVNHWINDAPLGLSLKRLYNAWQTNAIENMLVVKAEDFAKNPKVTMKEVYKFIDEPYFELDYSKVKQVTVENDRIADFGIYGDHKIRPSIEPLIPDFKQVLSPEIANSIRNNYKWFYEAFNYF